MCDRRPLAILFLAALVWSLGQTTAFGAETGDSPESQEESLRAESPPSCAAISDDAPEPLLSVYSARVLHWRPRAGESIECFGPGLEPRELSCLEPTCRPGSPVRVELEPARQVTVRNPTASDVQIELRRVTDRSDGSPEPSEFLYQAKLEAGAVRPLQVSRAERLIRFVRKGASPVSLLIRAGTDPLEVEVPATRTGGEIVLELERRRRVIPSSFVVDRGAVQLDQPLAPPGWLFLSGVPPGSMTLVPKYEGGLLGEPISLKVEGETTTELLPALLPAAGGVFGAIEEELCWTEEETPILELARVDVSERSTGLTVVWRRAIDAEACRWTVDGLRPGSYEASVRSPTGEALAISPVEVFADHRSEVWLGRGSAHLEGTVTFAEEEPAAGVRVSLAASSGEFVATTDALGRYELDVRPGDYRFEVRGARFLPARQERVRLVPGDQTHDVQLEGGVLEVRLVTEDGSELSEPVQVEIETEGRPATSGPVFPEEADGARFLDLAPGTYFVSASGGAGYFTQSPTRVELSAEDPYAFVELRLRHSSFSVHVTDALGSPVSGATVFVGVASATEKAPGKYEAKYFRPGNPVRILPPLGLSPACVVEGDGAVQEVVVAEAPYSAWIPWTDPTSPGTATVLGLPGSQCGVWLPADRVRRHAGWVEVVGLPAGELTIRFVDGVGHAVAVPSPPPQIDP